MDFEKVKNEIEFTRENFNELLALAVYIADSFEEGYSFDEWGLNSGIKRLAENSTIYSKIKKVGIS
jgi:hypothetical protein